MKGAGKSASSSMHLSPGEWSWDTSVDGRPRGGARAALGHERTHVQALLERLLASTEPSVIAADTGPWGGRVPRSDQYTPPQRCPAQVTHLSAGNTLNKDTSVCLPITWVSPLTNDLRNTL